MDGSVGVQNMTGHPSYYLYLAFPDGVKTEKVDKDEKRCFDWIPSSGWRLLFLMETDFKGFQRLK